MQYAYVAYCTQYACLRKYRLYLCSLYIRMHHTIVQINDMCTQLMQPEFTVKRFFILLLCNRMHITISVRTSLYICTFNVRCSHERQYRGRGGPLPENALRGLPVCGPS